MSSPSSFDAKTQWRATPDAIARLFHDDPAKALVVTSISQYVADGYAEWDVLDDGDIQLRFHTGETFLLAERTIFRLA